MDEYVLLLMLAVPLLLVVLVIGAFRNRAQRRGEAVVYSPSDVGEAIGTRSPSPQPRLKRAPANIQDRPEIDACLAALFAKQAVQERYQGVRIDDIPPLALRQLDKAIDESSHIKNTRNILGKIDALENNVEELVTLVAGDPMLTASLLRLANSAFYGVSGEVTSIRYAIDIVGIFNLKNLVYREYVLRERKGATLHDPVLFRTIWEHSLLTATAAAFLSGVFPGLNPATAYMTGLLHDIGKFLLLGAGLVETAPDSCVRPYCGGFTRSMQLVWHHDHALVGKVAALKWDFGMEIANAIGMHHYPELVPLTRVNADQGLIYNAVLIHMANQIAKHFSREPQASEYIVPLHFSYHGLVDRNAVRSILSGPKMLPALAKIKQTMSLETGQ